KPSQPKATQTAVVSAGGFVEVSCRTTGCRPAANISWLYQGYTTKGKVNATLNAAKETYTVDSFFRRQVTAADNGHNVQCVITHPALVNQAEGIASVNLNVRFKPLTATITGNRNIIANGKKTLTLVCTSGSSNPISDITWRINSVITPSNGNLSDQSGEYGGMKRRQILKLAPTRDNDNDSISCQAYNNAGTSEMSEVTLDLKYRPLIENMPEIIVVEGNSSVLTCVASSKPASTFRWFREQSTFLDQGNGTLGNNKFSYTINNVRRTDAATYRCNANNRVELEDNKNVRLKVYYPPDVTAIADNTTVKATTASILCNAKGVPSTNYMYGKWIQTWAGYNVPVSEKPESERLVLKNLTYEHSGVYTCSASNGIKVFGTNKEFMEGSVLLVVKSFPVITNVSEKTPAKFKENASLEVYYYSNVAGSEVKIYRNVNGSKQERIIYNASETRVEVSLPVFAHTVRTRGTKAQILIQILSQDDFGSYDVVVANEIGSSTRSFEIVPKGPPSMPNNLTVDSIQYNKAHLSWIRGYHGGLAQTFVIQLSTDLNIWNNITVYGGLNKSLEPISEVLPGLHDSTTYYIRMFAFNNEGSSPFTEILNYTTPSVPEEDKPSVLGAVIGATAGGISALIIISVVFVVLKRRGVFAK
ncbi:hemicentin-2-like, partial [Mercenaria mercenaria]|uniref:hemicentin-2-like n=1 Tax=Mercenaria mercenaria TaxID=6596 RepID=UPI00234F4664